MSSNVLVNIPVIGSGACALITHSISGWELHSDQFACDLNSHDLICKHSDPPSGCGINAEMSSCPQCQMTCNQPHQALSVCDQVCSRNSFCYVTFPVVGYYVNVCGMT